MSNRYFICLAAFVLYILPSTRNWYLAQAYHAGERISGLFGIVGLVLIIYLLILLIAIKALWPQLQKIPFGQILIRTVLFFPVLIGCIRLLRNSLFSVVHLEFTIRLVIVLIAILLSYIFARFTCSDFGERLLRSSIVKRIGISLLGAYAIFHLTGFLQSPIFESAKAHTVLNFDKISSLAGNGDNVLFLVLDEFTPEYASKLLEGLSSTDISTRVHTIAAPTTATINAIPTLLTGVLYDDMSICGSTTICSKTQKLDFKMLTARNERTDIVGIYHPYCHIKNIRNCYQSNAFFQTPLIDFFCTVLNFNGFGNLILPCIDKNGVIESEVDRAMSSVYEMPFWSDGGSLYIHLPLPHPWVEGKRWGDARESIEDHYNDKILRSREIVKELLGRLKLKFGDKFIFIVTSDHSLRQDMWCKVAFVCSLPIPEYEYVVPFIVISPNLRIEAKLPDNQLELFIN